MPEPVIRFEEFKGDVMAVLTQPTYIHAAECDALAEAIGLWLQNHPQRPRLLLDCRQTTFLHSSLIGPLRTTGSALRARGGDLFVIVCPDESEGGIKTMLLLTKTSPQFLTIATLG